MFRKKKREPAPQPAAVTVEELAPGLDPAADADEMNGLTLAYVGDAVYELMARNYILEHAGGSVRALHKQTVAFSNAAFQAYAAKAVLPLLTDAEAAVFRRGRNAHPGHVPKNKTQAQYHAATGLEALFGWLYLQKDTRRLNKLFAVIVSCSEGFEYEKRETRETEKRKEV